MKCCRAKNVREDNLHAALETAGESALATAAGQHLRLDNEVMAA